MFGQLIRKIFSRGDSRRVEDRSSITAPTPPSAPLPERVGGPLARRSDDAAALRAWLEDEARTGVDALLNALATDGRTSDGQRLIESFQESLVGTIRQPPVAAQQALTLTRNLETPVGKLVELVQKDPTLGQSLLRYANSAYYSTGGAPCASLSVAVQRVGLAGVHNVVLKCMLDVMMCRPGGSCQDLAEKSWSHMIRTAPIARALAPAFQVATDEAYAIGLLHDAGKMMIFDRVASLRTVLRRDLVIPYSALSAILRMLHEDLGALAALQWGLGATIAHAIATHHRAPVPLLRDPLSEVLFLAERCDLSMQRGKPLNLDVLWRDGGLSGSRTMVDRVFADPPADLVFPGITVEPVTVGSTLAPSDLDNVTA